MFITKKELKSIRRRVTDLEYSMFPPGKYSSFKESIDVLFFNMKLLHDYLNIEAVIYPRTTTLKRRMKDGRSKKKD
jgi:hypothetical protein